MSARVYFLFLIVAAVFALTAIFTIVLFSNPESAGVLGVVILYTAILFALLCLLNLTEVIITYVRHREIKINGELYFFYSFLASIFLLLLLYFSQTRSITMTRALMLFSIFSLLALTVFLKQRKPTG